MTAQQVLGKDPVKAALEAAKRFSVAFNGVCSNASASAVARRLKEFPQLLLQAGLTPALTFYASKHDEDKKWRTFIEALKALAADKPGSVDRNSFCEGVSGEGGGYPHALAVIYTYAVDVAQLSDCNPEALVGAVSSSENRRENLANARVKFVECLHAINSKGVRIERLVLAYVNEVKKLFTALYGERQR